MDGEFIVALSMLAAPALWGKVSLKRTLIVIFVVGSLIIAISWAHLEILGWAELRQLERRNEIGAQRDKKCNADQHRVCEAGYCDERILTEFATGIIQDASQCNQLPLYGGQAAVGTLSERGQRDTYEDSVPTIDQVPNFT